MRWLQHCPLPTNDRSAKAPPRPCIATSNSGVYCTTRILRNSIPCHRHPRATIHPYIDSLVSLVSFSWRASQVGYVGQEPVLFQGTIRENIAKGDPGASEARIQAAAKAANAHDFTMDFQVHLLVDSCSAADTRSFLCIGHTRYTVRRT